MKKVLARIMAIVLMSAFLVSPTTASAATVQTPILANDSGNFRQYIYNPSYYTTNQFDLSDITTSNGQWFVPAGSEFNLYCSLGSTTTFNVYILQNNQTFQYLPNLTADNLNYTFSAKPFDAYYRIILVPVSGPLIVNLYYGFWDYSVPSPEPVIFDDWTRIYTYNPDFILKAHRSFSTVDYMGGNGYWNVPAGKNFKLQVAIIGSYRIGIYDTDGNHVYTETGTSTAAGFSYTVPAQSVNKQYFAFVEALSDSTIYFYGGYMN